MVCMSCPWRRLLRRSFCIRATKKLQATSSSSGSSSSSSNVILYWGLIQNVSAFNNKSTVTWDRSSNRLLQIILSGFPVETHWDGSCSLLRCCLVSMFHGRWWCSSGWDCPHSEHQESSYRSLIEKTALRNRWRTSWKIGVKFRWNFFFFLPQSFFLFFFYKNAFIRAIMVCVFISMNKYSVNHIKFSNVYANF